MTNQAEEMRRYFALNNIKNTDISASTGFDRSTVSNILAGRRSISKGIAHKFASVYGFDELYLITGEGQLLPSSGKIESINVSDNKMGDNSPINIVADNSALKAENERLRAEVEWLRSMLEKREK